MDAQASLAKYRKMLAKFRGAAAGQYSDDFLLRVETLLAAKRLPVERGVHVSYQRMADEFYGDSSVAVEFLFKRENAQGLGEAPTYDMHAPPSPGPTLRTDVINVLDAAAFELSGKAQMEAGEIGKDGKGRFAALGFANEVPHGAHERRKGAEDFGDADDGHFGVVGDDVDAGGAHLRAAHAEDFEVSALLERNGQARGVHVAASFAGRKQKRDWRHA